MVEREGAIEVRDFEMNVPDVDSTIEPFACPVAHAVNHVEQAGCRSSESSAVFVVEVLHLTASLEGNEYVIDTETFVQFSTPLQDDTGRTYIAHACGSEMSDGLWQGWVEFLPTDGGTALATGRETTQPNRTDTEYWATGLTEVYLEGALQRALDRAGL